MSGGTTYSTYRCGACDAVAFESSSWDTEDYDHDNEGNMIAVKRNIQFPPPSSASFTFNTEHTPGGLDELIGEMMYAFAGAKLTLATVGLRMILDFIVRDKQCPGRNLAEIDQLQAQALIDERQKELLHKLREKGNAGAHEAAPMKPKEIIAGMGVIETLLERLYNGPGRHSALLGRAEAIFRDDPKPA